MTNQLLVVASVASLTFSVEAFAWQAQDTITGAVIDVVWPSRPSAIARDGNHEIQYRIGVDSNIRLGEVTGWLSKCHGKYCPTKQTRTFELNTFSNYGLMNCFPLEEP